MVTVKLLVILVALIDSAFAECPKIIGLNNTEQVVSLSRNGIRLATVGKDDEAPRTFSEKCLIFEKSFGSRGFYVRLANDTAAGEDALNLTFVNYGGHAINLYDFYWTSLEGQNEFKSTYVQGALMLNVSLLASQNAKFHVFESKFTMTWHNILLLVAIAASHVALTLYLLKRANQLEFCPWACGLPCVSVEDLSSHDDSDDYKRVKDGVKIVEEVVKDKKGKVKKDKQGKELREKKEKQLYKTLIKKGSGKLKKLKVQTTLKFLVHIFDIVTDVLYIATVPSYHDYIQIGLVVSMFLPSLAIICVQRRAFQWTKMQTFMALFGGLPFYELRRLEGKVNPKEMVTIQLRQGAPFVLEDGPQFILQMVNSLLVGQTWSWVQVISPVLSVKGIAYRFISGKSGIKHQARTTFVVNLFCLVPMLAFVLCLYVYKDVRPDWAKQFQTIRWGHEEEAYPVIKHQMSTVPK